MSASAVRDELLDFEDELRSREQRAWERFRAARGSPRRRASWTSCSAAMEQRVIPALRRIGFADEVSCTVFDTGSVTWQPVHWDAVVPMHPACTRSLTEVRRGVVEQARERSRQRMSLENMTLLDRDAGARSGAHPVHLRALLGKESTSWVVLPRVYDHLEERHVCHLLHYVRALTDEDEPAFERVLARVTIEFVGNYSVKYARGVRPRAKTLEALFHAYETLFWRNLRSPPPGAENALVFEGFLFWTAAVQRRLAHDNDAMRGAVARMQSARNDVFPPFDTFGRAPAARIDAGRLALSLRHGALGAETILRRFAVNPLFETETLGRLPFASVPTVLSVLYRQLARTYAYESRNTRRAIRNFFDQVGARYQLQRLRDAFAPRPLPSVLRFVAPRVHGMSREFAASLDPVFD